jgi:hypothetical protein
MFVFTIIKYFFYVVSCSIESAFDAKNENIQHTGAGDF